MPEKKEPKEVAKVEPSRALSPFEEMERRFEEFFRRPLSLLDTSWWPRMRMPEMGEMSPSVDIFEEADDVILKAELPGMKKEDIEVNVTGDTITISGEKKKEEKVEKKNYYRLERSHGSFSRSFRMPQEVQSDKIKAVFKEGVLEIRLPKTEEAKQREKKIAVE